MGRTDNVTARGCSSEEHYDDKKCMDITVVRSMLVCTYFIHFISKRWQLDNKMLYFGIIFRKTCFGPKNVCVTGTNATGDTPQFHTLESFSSLLSLFKSITKLIFRLIRLFIMRRNCELKLGAASQLIFLRHNFLVNFDMFCGKQQLRSNVNHVLSTMMNTFGLSHCWNFLK